MVLSNEIIPFTNKYRYGIQYTLWYQAMKWTGIIANITFDRNLVQSNI